MKLLPRSIRTRLLVVGLALTGVGLLLAGLLIREGVYDLVRRSLNERLDAQIALLLRSVRADGSVDGAMLTELGPFTQHRRGWGWQIETPSRVYASRDVPRLDDISWEGPRGAKGISGAATRACSRDALRIPTYARWRTGPPPEPSASPPSRPPGCSQARWSGR